MLVVGPNGSGKTTLLSILAGLMKLQSGKVEVFGKALQEWDRKEFARKVSSAGAEQNPWAGFTVLEMTLMGRTPYLSLLGFEQPYDLEIAYEALSLVGVEHLATRSMDKLSSGERQLVMMARALAQKPSLLILDEPTSHLDLKHQRRMFDLLEKLKTERGVASLAVCHDLNLASEYADLVLILKEGKVAALGSPKEVLTEKTIGNTFGVHVLVDDNPLSGKPRIAVVRGIM